MQVRPVLDPAHLAPVDGYETSARIGEAMRLRHPTEVFPYDSASGATADLDHTVPDLTPARGGPPGQTGLDLGPLSRPAHRAVTAGCWRRRQPEPGRYLFRSPTGHVFLVTNQGTQALGRQGSPSRSGAPLPARLPRSSRRPDRGPVRLALR